MDPFRYALLLSHFPHAIFELIISCNMRFDTFLEYCFYSISSRLSMAILDWERATHIKGVCDGDRLQCCMEKKI